jgi:hypothetical protein
LWKATHRIAGRVPLLNGLRVSRSHTQEIPVAPSKSHS